MQYNLKVVSIIGIIITAVLGIMLHSFYKWSGQSPVVGLIAPVNESVWEHLKLLFYPMLFWIIVGCFTYGKEYQNFLFAETIGLLARLVFIPIIFYTYTKILGSNYPAIDIINFLASIVLTFWIASHLLKSGIGSGKGAMLFSVVVLISLIYIFTAVTFNPPDFLLFEDPKK